MHRQTKCLLLRGGSVTGVTVRSNIVADNSSNADAFNLLGFAYRNAGDYSRAMAAYKRALKLNPKHTGALEYQGVLFIKLGQLDKARNFYAKALEFDANHAGALEYQGEMYVELGDMDKAKANLARLVTLCPSGCEERGDLEEAIAKAPTAAKAK